MDNMNPLKFTLEERYGYRKIGWGIFKRYELLYNETCVKILWMQKDEVETVIDLLNHAWQDGWNTNVILSKGVGIG